MATDTWVRKLWCEICPNCRRVRTSDETDCKGCGMTLKEAADQAQETGRKLEQDRLDSYQQEALFEQRQAFLRYGADALILGGYIWFLDAPLFKKRYGIEQEEAQAQLAKLREAIAANDFNARNEAIDFFTRMLT